MSASNNPTPGLGLYIHLPFCRTRCNYCAFAISTRPELDDLYTDAILGELDERSADETLETVYYGGGTPSRSSLRSLERIREGIDAAFDNTATVETTMEVNPEDVTDLNAEEWSRLGIDRFSIGVQSFDNSELRSVGRLHGELGAIKAIEALEKTGARLSLDLIAGLPSQSDESFRRSIDFTIQSGVGHVSVYMLDLEPGSPLESLERSGEVSLPSEDSVAARYQELVERFDDAGLKQYELSNFARTDQESKHNRRYWSRQPYLGVGLGAHSFDGSRRWGNTRNMRKYLEASTDSERIEIEETLTPDEARREVLMLGLRQNAGIERRLFEKLTGEKGETWRRRGIEHGWLQTERVAFTTKGFVLSNALISDLF